jgi:hypothetical protein
MRDGRPSFWIKVALIAVTVAGGDFLLWMIPAPGAGVGLLTLSWTAALAISNPAIPRRGLGAFALAAAAAFAALQIERPTAIGLLLFAVAFGVAALSPRAGAGDDVWRWAQRLAMGGLKSFWGPFVDLRRLLRAQGRGQKPRLIAAVVAVSLPLLGGAVFLALFATANPLIGEAFSSLALGDFEPGRVVFWLTLALPISAALRPRGHRRFLGLPETARRGAAPGLGPTSVAVSLVVFNLIFALENGLDIAYLWADARLPGRLTFAQYAHQGAYPLVATAILAGLFVVVIPRPGSAAAASRSVRALVMVWVAQNMFLVASAMLRTLDYIDAYSLTEMRIAALLWMCLVATGLALIAWRLGAGKSAAWLLGANTLAAGVVLAASSIIDFGAVAAGWNVRHAREAGGGGVPLDLCYMRNFRGAAVVSLAELERRPIPDDLRRRVAAVRSELVSDMIHAQSDWRGWRFRDARRLAHLQAMGVASVKPPPGGFFECDGRAVAPEPRTSAPLTPTPKPGT